MRGRVACCFESRDGRGCRVWTDMAHLYKAAGGRQERGRVQSRGRAVQQGCRTDRGNSRCATHPPRGPFGPTANPLVWGRLWDKIGIGHGRYPLPCRGEQPPRLGAEA